MDYVGPDSFDDDQCAAVWALAVYGRERSPWWLWLDCLHGWNR